jgi:hypothetical protein
MELRTRDMPVIIQLDADFGMTLNPGNRIYRDFFHGYLFPIQ